MAVFALPAAGQQGDGPIVITQRRTLEFMRLTNLRAAVELSFQFSEDEIDQRNGPSTTDKEELYKETLELAGDAFFGHPNLVDLDFEVRLNFEQDDVDFESTTLRGSEDRIENEFEIEALVLKESDMPVLVFANRIQVNVDRAFAGTLDTISTRYGAEARYRKDELTNSLRLSNVTIDQEDRFDNSNFKISQNILDLFGTYTMDDGHRLRWNYTYRDVEESGDRLRTDDFEDHDARLTHRYSFGSDQRHSLRSEFNYRNISGTGPLEQFRLQERLMLEHSPILRSRYDYFFNRDRRPGSDQTFHQGQAQVTHKLFASLVTNAIAGVNRLKDTESDFTSEQYFGSLELNYTKLVPLGTMVGDVNLLVNRREDSDMGGTIPINDFTATFSAGLITIDRRNVVPGSIVITDITGVIIYSENVDYTVDVFPTRVEIRRVLGGNIAAGQTVLIDFDIGPQPGGTTDTFSQGYSVRYRIEEGPLRGLSPYVRYLDVNEERPRGQADTFPEVDAQELTFGLEYDRGGLYLLAEHLERKSDVAPFKRDRLEARYRMGLARGNRFLVGVNHLEIENTDIDTDSSSTIFEARWDQVLSRHVTANVVLLYTLQDDSQGRDAEGFQQELGLDWRYRQTVVTASLRHNTLDTDASDSEFLTFFIGVRREF